jgi:cytochrome c1
MVGESLDEEAWAEVRRAFEETKEPVIRIAARYGISRSAVYDQAARENWILRTAPRRRAAVGTASTTHMATTSAGPPASASVAALAAPAGETELQPETGDAARIVPPPPDAEPAPRSAESHADRHQRFYRIIDRLLEKMEKNVTDSPDMSPQDQERSAKALSSTLTTMERVTDRHDELVKTEAKPEGGPSDGSSEAERMRREIAERLERLSAKWLESAPKPE